MDKQAIGIVRWTPYVCQIELKSSSFGLNISINTHYQYVSLFPLSENPQRVREITNAKEVCIILLLYIHTLYAHIVNIRTVLAEVSKGNKSKIS